MESKTLWLKAKKMVRMHENEQASLVFDDTIIEKPYMDENEIVCRHWDHKENRSVKGINVLSAFYTTPTKEGEPALRAPIGYQIISKTEKYIDKKDNKEKRKSAKTKNELMQQMISVAITNRVKFGSILADSWFASSDNMRFISKHSKTFVFEMKENR